MSKKNKESMMTIRTVNLILGFLILVLVLFVLSKDGGTEIYEMLIFALAAAENFIAAMLGFAEQKKMRGNVYAVLCAVFLIIAIVLAVRYFVL